MTTLDASIVNIGLPTIARAFGTPLSGTIEWVHHRSSSSRRRCADRRPAVGHVGRTPIWMTGLGVTLASGALRRRAVRAALDLARLLREPVLRSCLPRHRHAHRRRSPDQHGSRLGLGALAIRSAPAWDRHWAD